MSTCTFKIYNTDIVPSKNCIVDDIQDYLTINCINNFTATNYQYQKIEQEMMFKISVDQQYVAEQELGNYVDIYQDSKHYYFFINRAEWKAQSTVALICSLDTLNTFQSDFTLSSKTNIIRQHKNRWYDNTTNLAASTSYTKTWVIDKTDEGISGIATELSSEQITDSTTLLRGNWYLLYRTADELDESTNQPVTCELYPTATNLKTTSAVTTMSATSLSTGYYYYILAPDTTTITLYSPFTATSTALSTDVSVTFRGMIFKRVGDWIYSATIQNNVDGTGSPQFNNNYAANNGTWTLYSKSYVSVSCSNPVTVYYAAASTNVEARPDLIQKMSIFNTLAGSTTAVKYYTQIDRTDSRIIKIIECPYCPIPASVNSSTYVLSLPTGWSFKGNVITCTNLNYDMLRSSIYNKKLAGTYASFTTGSDITKMTKSINLEPKIYHSSISTCKLLYDSFSSEIKREQITPTSNTSNPYLIVQYKQSNTINSNLAFKWYTSYGSYTPVGDFDQYLLAKRNNEVTIYSSNYLNYLRTGYNYDKKTTARQAFTSGIGLATSIVGASASIASGNVLGAVYSLSGISSSINNIINGSEQIKQKLNELQAQAVSVSGSDDINLLNFYSSNKAYIQQYTPCTQLKEKLFDLFYYCGYAANIQDTPNTTSRWWFNYLQCEPDFINLTTKSVYNDYLEDIRSKFMAGVTYYHNRGTSTQPEYNFLQTYENWEIGLIN